MDDFKYYNFSLQKHNLVDYVEAAKNDQFRPEGIVEWIVTAMSENEFELNLNDPEICVLLEQLIREYGYDSKGHYSEKSQKAIKNLYIRRNLNPDIVNLKDVKVSHSIGERISLFAKSTANSVVSCFKSSYQALKKFWNKGRKYICGATILGLSIFGLKSSVGPYARASKESAPKGIKAPQTQQTISSDTFVWKPQAFTVQQNILPDSLVELRLDAIKKIEANKQAYAEQKKQDMTVTQKIKPQDRKKPNKPIVQKIEPKGKQPFNGKKKQGSVPTIQSAKSQQSVSHNPVSAEVLSHNDSIKNNAYVSSLAIHHKSHLIASAKSQIEKGIFKAEQGITKERIAHAYFMCQIYADYDKAGTKKFRDAFNSKTKLTPQQQRDFTNYILNNIGERGVKLQTLSIQKGNNNHHSAFNSASKKLQTQHIMTLKDIRKLHGR